MGYDSGRTLVATTRTGYAQPHGTFADGSAVPVLVIADFVSSGGPSARTSPNTDRYIACGRSTLTDSPHNRESRSTT